MQENQNNNQNTQEQELDINHLMQIRRDKLKELQEQGKDPFEITKFNRTNTAGEIKSNYEKFEQKSCVNVVDLWCRFSHILYFARILKLNNQPIKKHSLHPWTMVNWYHTTVFLHHITLSTPCLLSSSAKAVRLYVGKYFSGFTFSSFCNISK